ncbi:MAG TPA: GGDEF domain-containing protein [Parcubacteria group bacterium]|jgi:diguanylate cyclase (GGDEF)-like protein|nr:GGDEF domain-containing protein [Parcubacteria group bacterium]
MYSKLSHEELINTIKELEGKVHDLEDRLNHDKLTSLKNRGYFEEKSKKYLDNTEKIKADGRREWMGFSDISFLFFDIDHFKKINDTYGHNVGDEVLKQVADTLKKNLRLGDIVARWGGEEFVAILLGAHENEAKKKADEIRQKVEVMTFENPKDLKITISIGVAEFEQGRSFEDLVKHADEALYFSKQNGRNKVTTYSEIK